MIDIDFFMPFEGDTHEATIMMLPYRSDTWRKAGVIASKQFFEIIHAISRYEKVYVLVDKHVNYDIKPISNKPNIEILKINYNDCWARDTSPIFLTNNQRLLGVDFRFNAWGGSVDGLYQDYDKDDQVSRKICEALKLGHHYVNDFILEGGSIHTNGQGVFITTEACLLSKGRNPDLNKKEIEDRLETYLNAKKVIWLPRGIYNDETNEHVDNICCFVTSNTIAIGWTDDKKDPQYALSLETYKVLKTATNLDGNPFKIIKVVMPKPMYLSKDEASDLENHDSKLRLENDRLAGSYINYYQGKDYIILPRFNVKEDKIAYEQFKKIYPDKQIHQIESREILLGGGNIHCITMQIPKVK